MDQLNHRPRKTLDFKTPFPENIDKRFYTNKLKNNPSIFQGDGLQNLLCVNLPSLDARPLMGIILSNTCDVSVENKRLFDTRLAYAPIFNLDKYKKALIKKYVDSNEKSLESIESHIEDIMKQNISQIFYLPKGGGLDNDSIVFLDRVNNLPSSFFNEGEIKENRVFSLSDYGFYFFCLSCLCISPELKKRRIGQNKAPFVPQLRFILSVM